MSQSHNHSHAAGGGNEKKLALAVILTGGFMLAEIAGGLISGSLALLADAGHMLTDFASLALAWLALRIARRPATWKRSYGFDRFSVLAAFVNGLALFLIAVWICWEAYNRLRDPGEVLGGLMFWVALAGLAVNIAAFWILSRGEKGNLNVRAATLHVMGDLLGSVGAIIASIIIMTTGWTPADPLLSVFVALIILRAAWRIVKESAHILLEGAPEHLDRREIAAALTREVSGVERVDHIHAWSITEERPMITMEVVTAGDTDMDNIRREIKDYLRKNFSVDHATVEIKRNDVDCVAVNFT
ncbi:cation diffusion facilitator family transporter [Hyphococcus sp.]|uniref:cation diffusion facilitator family transporter n=1 Tax=Hyphococcus sp. TaxID=2038636 RepID=UPI003CCC26D4